MMNSSTSIKLEMEGDKYFTIESDTLGEYKEKGSKFYCYLYRVNGIEHFAQRLEEVKKEHFKARHHCYAYRLGYDGNLFRANDDGEPSGTAGKPIHGQLIKHDLTFTSSIVVRYFGGTKLGTSGLIRSYKEATIDAINSAKILHLTREASLQVTFDYSQMGKVMQVIKDANLNLKSTQFDEAPSLTLACPYSEANQNILLFKAGYLGRSIEDVTDDDSLNGAEIMRLEDV